MHLEITKTGKIKGKQNVKKLTNKKKKKVLQKLFFLMIFKNEITVSDIFPW